MDFIQDHKIKHVATLNKTKLSFRILLMQTNFIKKTPLTIVWKTKPVIT